jgi:hypothetical protein
VDGIIYKKIQTFGKSPSYPEFRQFLEKKEKKKQFITIFCVILAIWRLIAFAIYNHNAEFKEQMAKAGRS